MLAAMVREERDRLEGGPSAARRIEGWHRSVWIYFRADTEDDPLRAAPRASVGPSGGDGEPPPFDPSKERDRDLATKSRAKPERPPRFKVILYNDDYTPMEFVVDVLEKVFGKGPSAATQIMLQIQRGGMGVAGVYVLEIAETKVATVLRMAEKRGYPLRAGVEKE
jgi:ATP-dependent Clp protease adaptor protein ClpS